LAPVETFWTPGSRAMVARRDELQGGRTGANPAGQALGVGLQFAGAILLFMFLGRWLDSRLGTEPWLLLAGVAIGAVAGFYALYKTLVPTPRGPEVKRPPAGRR
jgi:ATP synthase protein I